MNIFVLKVGFSHFTLKNLIRTWKDRKPFAHNAANGACAFKPKFHLARYVTSRHDSTRSTCRASRDERVEPCCSNMADDEQAIVLVCTSLVDFMLLHTQILFISSNKIN